MKKILSVLLILSCLLVCSACQSATQNTASANKIVYKEKYIKSSDAYKEESQQNYFIFEKDCLKQHCYGKTLDYPSGSTSITEKFYHYTVTYKYEIMDEGTLAYFFDSLEIHPDDEVTKEETKTTYQGILLFSKNILSSNGGMLYVRESYLKNELPNFAKEVSSEA